MIDPAKHKEFTTTPEEAQNNRRQVWLILLVMLGSSCVGITALMVILWFLFKHVLPAGAL